MGSGKEETRIYYKLSNDQFSHDIHEIDPQALTNPSGRHTDQYLGRGSFGIVILKMYRGIYAAVKQMHIKRCDTRSQTASLLMPPFSSLLARGVYISQAF